MMWHRGGLLLSVMLVSNGNAVEVADNDLVLRFDPFEKPSKLVAATGLKLSGDVVLPPAHPPLPEVLPKLRGTVIGRSQAHANFNGRAIALGEEVDGFVLVAIEARRATLAWHDQRVALSLDDEIEYLEQDDE